MLTKFRVIEILPGEYGGDKKRLINEYYNRDSALALLQCLNDNEIMHRIYKIEDVQIPNKLEV